MAATCIAASAGAQDRSVAEILSRSERALGGSAALRALQSYSFIAQMDGLSGFPGTMQMSAQRPNKRRVDWDIRYISQSRGFNGDAGWERNANVRELKGPELLRFVRSSAFLPTDTVSRFAATARAALERDEDGMSYQVVRFKDSNGWSEAVFFDPQTFLPVREVRSEPYEDGAHEVRVIYGDYRRVGQVLMPFSIEEQRPDLSFVAKVQTYTLNPQLDLQGFANPNAKRANDPYAVSLATIPTRVYRERKNIWNETRFWGMYYPPTESWTFDLVVNEQFGRYLEPLQARIDSYAGNELIKSEILTGATLAQLRRFPVARFAPQPQIFNFRHEFSEPVSLTIDRMDYTLQLRTPTGATIEKTLPVLIQHYQQRHRLIFPVRGNFMIVNGHEAEELNHKYESSQHYAYDIVGLGPHLELENGDGTSYGFARTQVIAPADGTVVFARNDVPDGRVKREYLKMPDGKWAIGGNIVLLDHGDGEYSLFAHMHQGSVMVKNGDSVRQGDVIGLLGSSGSPGNPHLHYQLQANPGLFEGNGLPSEFANVHPRGWYVNGPFATLKRGVYLEAD